METEELGEPTFTTGDEIIFKPGAGKKPWRRGWFAHYVNGQPGVVAIRLNGDHFDVCVHETCVIMNTGQDITIPREDEKMPTAAPAITTKELRRQAKAANIDGWEEMTLDELKTAVNGTGKKSRRVRPTAVEDAPAPAKRTRRPAPADEAPAPKAKTKKAAAPAADEDEVEVAENGNPYKRGSHLWHFTEEAIKGGKRSAMVARLKKKITLKPRNPSADWDEDAEIDRRIQITAQVLAKDYGFTYEKEGRGRDAHLKVTKP